MRYRLIDTGAHNAADNMAIDEAILIAHQSGQVPPTLRFYRWRPPAVSIGRHQELDKEVDTEACRRLGIGLVRRPTGGRAVLHDREVTYAFVIAQSQLPGSVVETYKKISDGLALGLRRLGFDAQLFSPRGRQSLGLAGACFDTPSWHELTVSGKKVVGSAQVRMGGVILQHGSVLLEFDARKLLQVLAASGAGDIERLAAFYERKAAGLCQLAGQPLDYEEVCLELTAGLTESLGAGFEPGTLSPMEAELAAELSRCKYARDDWNERRLDRCSRITVSGGNADV